MAQPNQLNPSVARVGLPGNVWIISGVSTSNATIKAEIGVPGTAVAVGSIYIGSSTSTPTIWIAAGTNWTPITLTGL
jgi:hypothetical protein